MSVSVPGSRVPTNIHQLYSGLVIFLATLSAVVFLITRGTDAGDLAVVVGLAGPVIGAFFVIGPITAARNTAERTSSTIADVQAAVEKVRRQTDGELDARIREHTATALREVLAEHELVPVETARSLLSPSAATLTRDSVPNGGPK